jgi:DNA-binding CsgD family transcriptional regulator
MRDLCAADPTLSLTRDGLKLADHSFNSRLEETVRRTVGVDRSWSGRSGGELLLPARDDGIPRICVVVPLGPDNPFSGWISAVRAICYLVAPGALRVSTDGLNRIRTLYGLTQSEAEVGALLIAGRSSKAIAELRNVKITSVRQQIKAVLLKTDCRRQAELIKLRPLVEG